MDETEDRVVLLSDSGVTTLPRGFRVVGPEKTPEDRRFFPPGFELDQWQRTEDPPDLT